MEQKMEQKPVRVPFSVELARKITDKEIEGRIVTRGGGNARVADFNLKEKGYPLLAIADDSEGGEIYYSCDPAGKLEHEKDNWSDLLLEIPGYLTFKDGDVLSYEGGTFILKRLDGKDRAEYHASSYGPYVAFGSACSMKGLADRLRLATGEERRQLVGALKASKEPEAKDCLRRFFGIEEKPEHAFKPFDKVLVRDSDDEEWRIDFFSHKRKDGLYAGIGHAWKCCLPYSGQTARLLGTDDGWEG